MEQSHKLQTLEASLKRWHTRLVRASNMVTKLEKKRRRLMLDAGAVVRPKTLADQPRTNKHLGTVSNEIPLPELDAFFQPEPQRPRGHWDVTKPETLAVAARESLEDKRKEEAGDIPPFLKRDADVDAMKAKRRKAEEADRHKMPLSGRAALEAIKSPPRKRTKSDKA